MRKLVIIAALPLLLFMKANGQDLSCGLLCDTSFIYHFAKVNTLTGQVVFQQVLPGVSTMVGLTSSVDWVNNKYIVYAGITPSHCISIDMNSGAIVNTVLAPTVYSIQSHPGTGKLYGVWRDTSAILFFVSLDPLTGIMTPLKSMNVSGILPTSSVINPITNQYIVQTLTPTSRYMSFNLTTGAIIIDTPATQSVEAVQINPTTGVIYGLTFSGSTWSFVQVNPNTGQVFTLSQITGMQVLVYESAVLHPGTGHYTIKATMAAGGVHYLTLDIATGAVINDILALDNIMYLEECGLLTATHLTKISTPLTLYPNPMSDRSVIDISAGNDNLQLKVLDMQGREVSIPINYSPARIELQRGDARPGIYFLQVMREGQARECLKFVVL